MFWDITFLDLPFFNGMKKSSLIDITCLYCKTIFKVKKYRKDTAKYCSRSCGGFFARENGSRNCLICKKSFHFISCRANVAKYCSNNCRYIAHTGKGLTEYTCHHCNLKFKDSKSCKRKYCSRACVNKSNKKIWNPAFSTIRKAMLSCGMIKSCNRCGFNENINILGVHHIDRDRKNNKLDNLEVLCPNCHSIEHSKHINHAGSFE